MYFSLRKTLTLLHIHRRTRSESSVLPNPIPQAFSSVPHSSSLTSIDALALAGSNTTGHRRTTRQARGSPSMALGRKQIDLPGYTGDPNNTEQKLMASKRRIFFLENKNSILQDEIDNLKLTAAIKSEELVKFKSDYYGELSQSTIRKRQTQLEDTRRSAQEQRLAQAEIFVKSLVSLDLHDHVLTQAWNSIWAGKNTDEALVDAITKAAAKPGSIWSRIIPTIAGHRSPEDYISAINLTLKTRQELKYTKQIAKFWKSTAKTIPACQDIVTPSSSNLSSVSEVLSEERQKAVNELLHKIRSGNIPCTRVVTSPRSGLKDIGFATISPPIVGSTSVDRVSMYSTSSTRAAFTTLSARDLAPLASQVLRDEVIASCSSSRLSLSSLRSSLPMLASVDVNQENKKTRMTRSGSGSQTSRLSAKALGKRKGVFISESIESITASFSSASSAHSSIATGLADSTFVLNTAPWCSPDSTPESDGVPRPSRSGTTSDTAPNATDAVNNSSTLYAEKALKSLEHICANFDSGSLGSLRTITEESEGESSWDRTLRAASNNQTEPSSSSSNDSVLDAPSPPIKLAGSSTPKSTTPPSAKKSMLPVFRNLRRLSLTGSPTQLKPNAKPAGVSPERVRSGTARRPTVSSSLKIAETSPTRSFLAKKTLPLQINKKNMGPLRLPKQATPTKAGSKKSLSKGAENIIPATRIPKGNKVARRLSRIMV